MGDRQDELIPPDDPRFEGAEFLNDQARTWHVVEHSGYLQGACWRWARWRPREGAAAWDHDRCHFCHDKAFSERYDGDLREGWTTSGPAALSAAERHPDYHWVCPECFELYRDQFSWTIESTP